MKTDINQIITLTIEGTAYQLTRNEAEKLRDQLNNILSPNTSLQAYQELSKFKEKFVPCYPATPPQSIPIPMADLSPRIICHAQS